MSETTITEPSDEPAVVELDAQGKPIPITVSAEGFAPGSQVFVEVCNGRPPDSENWAPTRDCDLGTSPTPALVDQAGAVTFPAGDANRELLLFNGTSPQELFKCVVPGTAPPDNGLPTFENCQIRVSSNNFASTPDQTVATIALGKAPAGSDESHAPVAFLAVGLLVVLVIAALAFVRARRRSRRNERSERSTPRR